MPQIAASTYSSRQTTVAFVWPSRRTFRNATKSRAMVND